MFEFAFILAAIVFSIEFLVDPVWALVLCAVVAVLIIFELFITAKDDEL